MSTEHLDLAHEFPQYADKIHYLKQSNAHFKKLFEKYQEVDRAVARAEQRIDALSDVDETRLRKERLVVKEELVQMLEKHY